ncbi:hypothetical protein BS47DRAFT_1002285 [Hydnum rufescens UP504]|uniref:ATP-dependent DNA helicase n=1 Tax=Hydnum rufescens UP504 TaxID=1448309 RepID=A0A9P6B936_9AGAM|nr:hypothetical protein BS47DRAFT_1002285 [Hydnum rufescens UP504]
MDQARSVLKNVFGYPEFKLSQAQVVERLVVDNSNCLVLYPTGGGKSLCYQIPGICLPGLTLVISPLIALMKDQVDVLRAKGVKASNLDSTLSIDEGRAVKESIVNGSLKILYAAPERLNNEGFIQLMRNVTISLLAVDESHCISQWGASFRPDYLKIARFAEEFSVERCLCLTATATPEIAEDICKSFKIDPEHGVFRTPMYRPNLSFLVKTATSLDDKISQVVPILKSRTGPAIVYVTLQQQAQDTAMLLKKHGLDAKVYHAGIPSDERQAIQNHFMASDQGIVVATIAFGMGIDKNNIRQVIHLYMPKTLEGYSQEVGRAGRDGLKSSCVLFLCADDIPVLEGFCRGDTCSQTSVELWLGEVLLKAPEHDGALAFNHYEQGRLYDIRTNTLGLLYAELELQLELIRAVTPFYTIYYFTPCSPEANRAINDDSSPSAVAVRRAMRHKGSGYEIDVVASASEAFPRDQLAHQITRWEIEGLVDVKASQVRHRYQILKPLPNSMAEITAIAEGMYQGMLKREADAVARLHRVLEFATVDDCLAQTLAAYFGDATAVPEGMCGSCTFCLTGAGTTFDPKFNTAVDEAKENILVFGSMVETDFNVLLELFTKACEDGGGQKAESPPPSDTRKSAAKRTYSQASGSTAASRGRGSRGVYAKRGRYS